MSIEQQKQIKENSMELQEFLKDLTDWEHTVKEKEKKLVGGVAKKVPPVRGQTQTSLEKEEGSAGSGKATADGAAKKAAGKAAAHTYDYFKDKWDKFDVDAALAEVDEEPQKPSPRKVARTSKAKTTSTKTKVEDKSQKPSVVNTSSSYSFGGGLGPSTLKNSSNAYGFEEGPVPDAMSEKDLGNENFKEGKFVQAIECYSRSIALQPTAVALANRAMASLKIRRYADAEVDCTEAITLDDRYTKAYSRRGTARKELQKYLAAVEDFEFALRLEPENKELKKQYVEAKEIYEKFAVKAKPMQKKVPVLVQELPDTPDHAQKSTAQSSPKSALQNTASSPGPHEPSSTTSVLKVDFNGTEKAAKRSSEEPDKTTSQEPASPITATTVPAKAASLSPTSLVPSTGEARANRKEAGGSSTGTQEPPPQKPGPPASIAHTVAVRVSEPVTSPVASTVSPKRSDVAPVASTTSPPSSKTSPTKDSSKSEGPKKQAKKMDSTLAAEVIASTQASVERAAINARAGLARNMVAPKNSYEFEATWKGFAGDRPAQARLLKIMDASSFSKVFKDSLGAPLLMEIINSLPMLLPDDGKLVVGILENLTRVGRFGMTVMFLTSKDKAVLRKLWDDVLATVQLAGDEQKQLEALRTKYRM